MERIFQREVNSTARALSQNANRRDGSPHAVHGRLTVVTPVPSCVDTVALNPSLVPEPTGRLGRSAVARACATKVAAAAAAAPAPLASVHLPLDRVGPSLRQNEVGWRAVHASQHLTQADQLS